MPPYAFTVSASAIELQQSGETAWGHVPRDESLLGVYNKRFDIRHKLGEHLFAARYEALAVEGSGNPFNEQAQTHPNAQEELRLCQY